MTKRKLYERFGVAEYWIVEPELDAIGIYRRESGDFRRVGELAAEAGDGPTTPLLPGFCMPLAAVFAPPM